MLTFGHSDSLITNVVTTVTIWVLSNTFYHKQAHDARIDLIECEMSELFQKFDSAVEDVFFW